MNTSILDKRVIDITSLELLQLIDERLTHILDQREKKESDNKVYSINELVKMNCIGGRVKIHSLIQRGYLQTTPDKKIPKSEVEKYLQSKKK
jgi:DNA replication protein DnaD